MEITRRDYQGSLAGLATAGAAGTGMVCTLKIYSDAGFDGPIRPGHAPATASDNVGDRGSPGCTMGAKVLAFGHMRGIMHVLKLPYA